MILLCAGFEKKMWKAVELVLTITIIKVPMGLVVTSIPTTTNSVTLDITATISSAITNAEINVIPVFLYTNFYFF